MNNQESTKKICGHCIECMQTCEGCYCNLTDLCIEYEQEACIDYIQEEEEPSYE